MLKIRKQGSGLTVRNLTRPWSVLVGLSVVCALTAIALSASSVEAPTVVHGDVWVLPRQTFAIAACFADGEVWVSLARGVMGVFDTGGNVKRWLSADFVRGMPVYDGVRGRLYISGPLESAVYVVDAQTHEHVETIQVPAPVHPLTIAGDVAYANAFDESVLYVVDLVTQRVLQDVKLSQPGRESVVVGDKLYVATGAEPGPGSKWSMSGAAVDIVSLTDLRLEKTLAVPGAHLRALAWDSGNYVYAASNVAGKLVRLDTSTDTLDDDFGLDVGRVKDIVIDPVHRLALLACEGAREELSVVSLETLQETARFEAGSGFMAVEREPGGALRNIWVPNVNGSYVLHLNASELVSD